MRKGERRDEAADDDVHDDAHVHVPHEHALLCQSSLCFSITPSEIEFPVPGGHEGSCIGEMSFLFH